MYCLLDCYRYCHCDRKESEHSGEEWMATLHAHIDHAARIHAQNSEKKDGDCAARDGPIQINMYSATTISIYLIHNYVYTHTYIYTYIHIRIYIHIYIFMNIYIYIYMLYTCSSYMYTCIYIYIYMCIYT